MAHVQHVRMALHHRNHHVPKEVLQSAMMAITPCVAMAIHLPDLPAVLVPAKMARNLPAMAVLLYVLMAVL